MFVRTNLVRATVVAIALLVLAPAPSRADYTDENRPAPVMVDVLVMRPLGLLATMFGTMAMVPVAAIMTITGHPHEMVKPARALVVRPGKFTFVDPIGSH